MIKTRVKAFHQAHSLLCEIRDLVLQTESSASIAPLKALQKLLIKEISRAERKVRRTKACLQLIDTAQDADEANVLIERLEDYRHLAYNWRCFGDAVAFLFMDKFALKQTYYNTQNVNPRQDAGFLIDKMWTCRGLMPLL